MPQEIEAKFKLASFDAVEDALVAAGAQALGTAVQTDSFFDYSDARLRKADSALRIRDVQPVGSGTQAKAKAELTFKGPRSDHKTLKSRLELQSVVADPASVTQIFKQLGLELTCVVQKRRRSFQLGSCLVELDQLPNIGSFVEIEGPDEAAIESVRQQLGLGGESITQSYLHLLVENAAQLGQQGNTFLLE